MKVESEQEGIKVEEGWPVCCACGMHVSAIMGKTKYTYICVNGCHEQDEKKVKLCLV